MNPYKGLPILYNYVDPDDNSGTAGFDRNNDRGGIALSELRPNGRVRIQKADGTVGPDMIFVADIDAYDLENNGNRSNRCWLPTVPDPV